MKRIVLIIALSFGMLCGCSDTKSSTGGTVTTLDAVGSATGGQSDAGVSNPGTTSDVGLSDDAGTVRGAGNEPMFNPMAWVFEANPIDTPEPTQVKLQHLDEGQTSLKGAYANVRNCLPNKETGQKVPLNMGGFALDLTICTPTYAAQPGDDGTFLHIAVPENHGTGDDSFAELMMYHHMQLIHDYFKGVHGMTDLDLPLDSLVNLQVYIDICNEWASISNAAFIPGGALDQFGFSLDFGIEGDAIMFSQSANKDFSYDADVIYHEYTHAMVGATRLNAVFADVQGMNNMPGALNEAYADYFAATLANESVVGNYALNGIAPMAICGQQMGGAGGNQARNLTNFRSCPDDLTAEVHADGEIFGSALWAVREAVGAEKADEVILDALAGFTNSTDFNIAATFTVSTAQKLLSAEDAAKVEKAFSDRGLIGCKRILPIENVGVFGIPLSVIGTESLNPNPFGDYAPGYTQLGFEVPEGAQQITIAVNTTGGGGGGGFGGGFGGGGGGSTISMDAAFKPGDNPITYTYSFTGQPATTDAAIVLPLTASSSGNVYVATLSGPCLKPGPMTFSIHNKGGGTSITKVSMTSSKEPADTPNFVECK